MAPWAKAYTVDIKEIYTELTLEKIENEPTGPEGKRIDDYKELFVESPAKSQEEQFRSSPGPIKPRPSKRILGKGEPGYGKTCLGKKISWDWAKGLFTAVSIVFFVSLKLVRPGELIENIIIQQTPVLEGLGVTPKKMNTILNTFGAKCLIILDGLDEIEIKKNRAILEVLKGQRFLRCNIIVTSRPGSTTDFEEYFDTVIQVQGFTEKQAEKYVCRFLVNPEMCGDILRFHSENFAHRRSTFLCPMMLLFVCILVNNGEVELTNRCVTFSEIYTRLIRCLYRKFTVRKGLAFSQTAFEELLEKVGKLSLKTLKSRDCLLQRNEVMNLVGEEAFECGLLTGYDDFRLIAHPTKDILVTYPHRTIEEFLGAFTFVRTLDAGATVEQLSQPNVDDSVVMTNYTFLLCCLWFLNLRCVKEYFALKSPVSIETDLKQFISNLVNFPKIDAHHLFIWYKALDIHTAHERNDQLILNLFRDVLMSCDKVKHLMMNYILLKVLIPFEEFLDLMEPVLPQLLSIQFIHYDASTHLGLVEDLFCPEDLNIMVTSAQQGGLEQVVSYCRALVHKPISLYFYLTFSPCGKQLSDYIKTGVQKVHIIDGWLKMHHPIFQQIPLPTYPSLTHLSLCGLRIDDSVLSGISTAVEKGEMPQLSHLILEGNGFCVQGKLPLFFQCQWPSLNHLNLWKCALNGNDLRVFAKGQGQGDRKLFPKLNSLALSLSDESDNKEGFRLIPIDSVFTNTSSKWQRFIDADLYSMFKVPWLSLTKLYLHDVYKEEYREIVKALNKGIMPNLTHLGIYMWRHVAVQQNVQIPIGQLLMLFLQVDEVEYLPYLKLRNLTHLTLQRFICSVHHLYMVTKTRCLTSLLKLDISHSSGIAGCLSILLCHSFPELQTLILNDCGLNSKDLSDTAQACVKGRLPELKRLDLSENLKTQSQVKCLFEHSSKWQQIQSLDLFQSYGTNSLSAIDLQCLSTKMISGHLSSLKELTISSNSFGFFSKRKTSIKFPHIKKLHIFSPLHHIKAVLKVVQTGTANGSFPRLHTLRVTQVDNPVGSYVKVTESFRHSISDLVPNKDIERVLDHVIFTLYMDRLTTSMIQNPEETPEQTLENLDVSSVISLVNEANEDKQLVESQAELLVDSVREFMVRYHYARMINLHQVAAEVTDDTIIKTRNSLNTRGVDTRITDFNAFTTVWRHFYLSFTENFDT